MEKTAASGPRQRRGRQTSIRRLAADVGVNWQLYLLILPSLVYYIVFHYVPMYGVQIAFRDYIPAAGFLRSEWVGLENFRRFFNSFNAWPVIRNTLSISLLSLVLGFPFPILLALSINSLRGKSYRKSLQLVSYAPHFISTVAMVGMITVFFSDRGMVNSLLRILGLSVVNFLSDERYFAALYVTTGIWQEMGWSSIIYLSALSGIDPELHEAAIIDGASKARRVLHVDLPGIAPIIVILLILRAGSIMSVGYEKVFLMQNPLNLSASEVVSTYVYKVGLLNADYSYSAAIGLFNSVVNCMVLICVNTASRRLGDSSLW